MRLMRCYQVRRQSHERGEYGHLVGPRKLLLLGVGQAHQQPMVLEHSDGGIQNPVQEPSSHKIDLHKQETSKLVIRPYVSKILGRSFTEVINTAGEEKSYERSELHHIVGSIRTAGKARHRGNTATDPGLLRSAGNIFGSSGTGDHFSSGSFLLVCHSSL
ncbi:hypothetical protein AYI68_g437 [Smittium mucronatum]|uniref:Uncharacterized protein n=1 Tax=Smittium mucronatum TaxID=133383 RepID=A0A1R0H8A0_9FUNG|nr:hypothetical protein AYI68_g437 [Smittium mucronatum]